MEFPSKKDVGINLTYGLDGFGTISPSLLNDLENKESFFKLPRKRTTTQLLLQAVPKSFQIHYDGNITHSNEDKLYGLFPLSMRKTLHKRSQIETINNNIFVPEQIMKQASISRDYTEPKKFLDPCINSLIKVLKFSNGKQVTNKTVLISTGGPLGNILTFTTLDTKHDPTTELKAFPFGTARSLKLSYKVTHISSSSKEGDYQMIGVLTENSLHILKITYPLSYINIESILKFEKDKLAGFEFSHMDFSKSAKRFAVADVKGNFAVFSKRTIESKIKYLRLRWHYKTIYDPVELSNFKKIFWSRENKAVYIMTRSAIHLAQYDSLECKVIANAWSKLLDFVHPSSSEEKIGFLLTTKELIVVDEENGFKRLLAWKHNLNERDMSLNLKVAVISQTNYLCLISSRSTPFTYALEIIFDNGTPKVLNTPYMISQHPSEPLQSFDLLPLDNSNKLFIAYQILENREISSLVLIRNKDLCFKTPINQKNLILPVLNDAFVRDRFNYKDFYQLLFNYNHDTESDDDNKSSQIEYDNMQKYADSISNSLNKFLNTPDRLYTFLINNGESTGQIKNIEELESMVFQLMNFYFLLENGLNFSLSSNAWLTSNFQTKNITNHKSFEEFTNIHGFMKKLVPPKSPLVGFLGNISKEIGISLLTISKKTSNVDQLEERIAAVRSTLDHDKSALLDEFSDDENAGDSETLEKDPQTINYVDSYLIKSQSQIPTISLSQNIKPEHRPRKRKVLGGFSQLPSSQIPIPKTKDTQSAQKSKAESQPVLRRSQESQSTQSQPLFSQVVGGVHGSNVRKKKKRKTGFL